MMNVNFKPGFTVINIDYDNPSSGGQSTVKPGKPGVSYQHSKTGLIYMYIEDGYEGTGWYYTGDDGLVYDPNVNPDDLIELG